MQLEGEFIAPNAKQTLLQLLTSRNELHTGPGTRYIVSGIVFISISALIDRSTKDLKVVAHSEQRSPFLAEFRPKLFCTQMCVHRPPHRQGFRCAMGNTCFVYSSRSIVLTALFTMDLWKLLVQYLDKQVPFRDWML
jgi:hypothetical protein